MERYRCRASIRKRRPSRQRDLLELGQDELDIVDDDCGPERGTKRAELPEMGTVIGLMAVLTAGMRLCGENETGPRHAAGTEDEGTALADRRRHEACGHDDAYREADEISPISLRRTAWPVS